MDPEGIQEGGGIESYLLRKEKKNRPARELSGGQRQILALSRILILRPRLVLLDEPSFGLAPQVVDLTFQKIKEMNKKGISFLLVEQNARKGLPVQIEAMSWNWVKTDSLAPATSF